MMKNFYNKYKLIILGCILFSLYFWSRFLRGRTSKVLPLNLNIISFFVLLYICCIFTYILISLLKTSSNKNPIIEQLIDLLFTPIMEFDKYLKSFSIIKSYYKQFLVYVIPKLDYVIIKTNLFYIMFWVFPRLILLSALFIDVFYFGKLHYKYMVILFGLLLFLNRYFIYSLKNTKENMLKELNPLIDSILTEYYPWVHPSELEPDYDPDDEDNDDIPPTMNLPLDIYIKFQTESIVYRNVTNFWRMILASQEWHDIILPNTINEDISLYDWKRAQFFHEKSKEFLEPQIKHLLDISLILEYYNFNINSNKNIKQIKIFIYLNYLLCWLYVLIISLHTLNLEQLMYVLNETWLSIENPFTP